MALISAFQIGRAAELHGNVPINEVGITTLRANVGGMDVSANVHSISVRSVDARAVLCSGNLSRCTGIRKIGILVNKKSMIVPASAFSDLAGLRVGRIIGSGRRMKLILLGGEQSESYRVEIEFDDVRVISRTVYSLLENDMPLEKTVYYEVVLD